MSDRFRPLGKPLPDEMTKVAEFMSRGWTDDDDPVVRLPVADEAARRRARLAERLSGERIVVPAGALTPRVNDTDFRFRAATAHVYLTGNQTSDAVLVMDDGAATLYYRPRHGKSDHAFWSDGRYGEAWSGRRRSLAEASELLGIECRHLFDLPDALTNLGTARVLRGVDPDVDALVAPDPDGAADGELATYLAEMRLVKDEWELAELQDAIDRTARGFEDCVRDWSGALRYGERWLEGTFYRRARTDGNDVGYLSICAAGPHATTLHWIENDGPVLPGQLVLLDMGVENRSLYTADITRTLPVDGRFTAAQRDLYRLVYDAQQAGMAAVRPGAGFREFHHAAQAVLAAGLHDMGVLPCSAEESMEKTNRLHHRWTLHGTGHMLGLDVHDCTAAREENYLEGKLEPGMALTVEPGLYFQSSDLLVPEELRGVGIRIEDDVVVTEDGCRNLSAGLPRTAEAIEEWMGELLP